MLWAQLMAVVPLGALGVMGARRLARARWWWVGFVVPLAWVTLVMLGHRSVRLSFVPPVSWAVDAEFGPFVMALVVPLMLTTLMLRLPRARRTAMVLIMGIMVGLYAVLPALCPLLVQSTLAAGATKFDRHGVCLQTHGYTCGPAAAVTCLRVLGIPAQEGALAIAAKCGPVVGTDAQVLAKTLSAEFGGAGRAVRESVLASLDELPVPCVADMFMPTIGGHYVAVLAVGREEVEVGDPYSGWYRLPRKAFEEGWKNAAITFHVVPGGGRTAIIAQNR